MHISTSISLVLTTTSFFHTFSSMCRPISCVGLQQQSCHPVSDKRTTLRIYEDNKFNFKCRALRFSSQLPTKNCAFSIYIYTYLNIWFCDLFVLSTMSIKCIACLLREIGMHRRFGESDSPFQQGFEIRGVQSENYIFSRVILSKGRINGALMEINGVCRVARYARCSCVPRRRLVVIIYWVLSIFLVFVCWSSER